MRVQAKIAHMLPGRTRFSISEAAHRPELLEEIRKLAENIPEIQKLEVNATTGSFLIHHRRDLGHQARRLLTDKALEAGLFSLAVPEYGAAKQAIDIAEKEAKALAQHSPTAKAIVISINRLNQLVKESTGNVVDLRRGVLAGAAVFGIVKSIRDGNAVLLGLVLAAVALQIAFELFLVPVHPSTPKTGALGTPSWPSAIRES